MEIPGVTGMIPMGTGRTSGGERAFDIYRRLLNDRIVFIGTPIDDQVATLVIGQLLYLEREAPERDIRLYLNSPGGGVSAGLAIYDAMQAVSCDVATFALGAASGMASLLLAGGATGKRFALPHARITLQPVTAGLDDARAETAAAEARRLADRVAGIIARHTGRSAEQVSAETERDLHLTPEQALAYGLIDEVLTPDGLNRFRAQPGDRRA